MTSSTSPGRIVTIVVGVALVVAGVAVFVVTDGLTGLRPSHLGSAALAVVGIVAVRYGLRGTRRRRSTP
ncbi:hypothetical protein GCM10009821_27950 [Aeromicrobium halocynthiae]|uniref:Uncharacterized protein n=1 Tax=Aeromicrobium halocynthiae TaxID=560557 RepID=A0ABP5HTM9_9ACTN